VEYYLYWTADTSGAQKQKAGFATRPKLCLAVDASFDVFVPRTGGFAMELFCNRHGTYAHLYSDSNLSVTCIDHIKGSKLSYRHKYAELVSHRADRTPSSSDHHKRPCELPGMERASPTNILFTMPLRIRVRDGITGLTSSQCRSHQRSSVRFLLSNPITSHQACC